MAPRSIYLLLILILNQAFLSQTTSFGDEVKWTTNAVPVDAHIYKNDLVVLDEYTQFSFYPANPDPMGRINLTDEGEFLKRNVIFKVNSEKGLETLKNFKLPESFDPALDIYQNKQGRKARIKTPYTDQFKVQRFAGRKFSNGKWQADRK